MLQNPLRISECGFTFYGCIIIYCLCFCRNHFHKHGFGNPVVVEEGAFCAALHRQYKEFCRARIELVTASGMVSAFVAQCLERLMKVLRDKVHVCTQACKFICTK